MLQPLDYILDTNDNFWIICYKQGRKIFGKIIYYCDYLGTRFNHITGKRYIKGSGPEVEIPADYKMEFHPREFYQSHKSSLDGVWKKYVEALHKSEIPDEDIGIFGSYLIGFSIIKDVDFVIYDNKNLCRYHKNRDFIKEYTNTTYITDEHIQYQYKKYRHLYHHNCDLLTALKRNWSGIQIAPGVLSTPRFIDDTNSFIPQETGENRLIQCDVISGIASARYPRHAKVFYNNNVYEIITPLWMLQSFAKEEDRLQLFANVNDNDRTILLTTKEHWIQYLN